MLETEDKSEVKEVGRSGTATAGPSFPVERLLIPVTDPIGALAVDSPPDTAADEVPDATSQGFLLGVVIINLEFLAL